MSSKKIDSLFIPEAFRGGINTATGISMLQGNYLKNWSRRLTIVQLVLGVKRTRMGGSVQLASSSPWI